MKSETSTTPSSNTKVHRTHTLLTEQDLIENPLFTQKHPYLAREVRVNGFKVCKSCGKQGVENLGGYCGYYRPRTKPTGVAMAVKQACGVLPKPGDL